MEEADKIFSSLEEACSEGNLAEAEQKITKLLELGKENEQINEVYSKAVHLALDAFKGRFSSTKVKRFITNMEELIKKYPKNKQIVTNFAKILRSSLIAMRTKGQPNVMKEIIQNLEMLADTNPDNIFHLDYCYSLQHLPLPETHHHQSSNMKKL